MPPAKKILIVDDEAMIRKAVHLALEKEGYEVVEAETGAEALRRIELSKPDLILLDIMLPDVSGFDVCRDIRKAGLRVPIIILSAKTEEIDVVVGLEIGADDHIRNLRRKIEQDPSHPFFILAVPGIGYRFTSAGKLG